MTPAQQAAIKADILANNDLNSSPNDHDNGPFAIAALYNLNAAVDHWVWRSSVSRADLYSTVDWEGGSWNWATYKGQSVTEQNAWVQMFMGDTTNFAQPNVRAGVSTIFGAANAQTAHCLSVGRRKATRIEKLLATGTGSTAAPAVMGFEGAITPAEIDAARNS